MTAIGVARADDAGLLAAAGADLVVTRRRRHHRPLRRKAGHAKGITPHDNGIAPVPGYGQRVAAADSGLGNVHRLTRSAWYRRSCARRITTYRTADIGCKPSAKADHGT
jgi:hypothetical protein